MKFGDYPDLINTHVGACELSSYLHNHVMCKQAHWQIRAEANSATLMTPTSNLSERIKLRAAFQPCPGALPHNCSPLSHDTPHQRPSHRNPPCIPSVPPPLRPHGRCTRVCECVCVRVCACVCRPECRAVIPRGQDFSLQRNKKTMATAMLRSRIPERSGGLILCSRRLSIRTSSAVRENAARVTRKQGHHALLKHHPKGY